jgi:hypothetical protein
MKDESAIGRGLASPIWTDLTGSTLTDYLVEERDQPDDKIAFVLGVCSSYAYGDAHTVATMMERLGLTRNRCRMISEYVDALFLTSTAYLIQSHDGRVVILCYRGTPPTSVITWLTDLQVEPVTISVHVRSPTGTGTGEVHGGFYRNVRSTRFKIVELLQAALAGKSVLDPAEGLPDEPPQHRLEALYVTGHSLGGASAAMLAALLEFEPIKYGAIAENTRGEVLEKLRAVYTYGAPMIGDPAFAAACQRELGKKVVRYVYANDLVPQVPPKASGPFGHFGQEYRYTPRGKDGHWHETTKRPRKQLRSLLQLATAPLALVARWLKLTRPIPFHASLSDHLPQHYLEALTPDPLRSEFGS